MDPFSPPDIQPAIGQDQSTTTWFTRNSNKTSRPQLALWSPTQTSPEIGGMVNTLPSLSTQDQSTNPTMFNTNQPLKAPLGFLSLQTSIPNTPATKGLFEVCYSRKYLQFHPRWKKKRQKSSSSLRNAQDEALSNTHQELLACSQKHFTGHRVGS